MNKSTSEHPKGEDHYKSKLTDEMVLEIRASNLPTRELSEQYKVHPRVIQRVRKGEAWKHVEVS